MLGLGKRLTCATNSNFHQTLLEISNLVTVLRRITFAPSSLLAIFTAAFSVYAAKKQYFCACINERVKYIF